jgi:hypothetical protein
MKSFLDAQNLSGSSEMVRYELNASRQRPAHRQKIDRLDSVPAMVLVHTSGQLPFLSKQGSRLVPFEFGSNLGAKMSATSLSINELISLPDWVSRTTTMLDFVNLPGGPLRHAIADNTHRTHTARIFALSPRRMLGFLNLESGFDFRSGTW